MKTKILIVLFMALMVVSCEKGTTKQKLFGDEATLPAELKGLKVYNVSTGISEVKVAILNGQVNSLTYPVGKTQSTTIVIRKDHYDERLIEVKEILMENDSLMLIRKK